METDRQLRPGSLLAGRPAGSAEITIVVEPRGRTPVTPHTAAGTEVSTGSRINGVPSHWYLFNSASNKASRTGFLRWEWAPGALATVMVNDYANPEQVATGSRRP